MVQGSWFYPCISALSVFDLHHTSYLNLQSSMFNVQSSIFNFQCSIFNFPQEGGGDVGGGDEAYA